MSAKKELERSHHGERKDPNDYESLISPHNIYENAKGQKIQIQSSENIASFSGYTNAETQTKNNEVSTFAAHRTQAAQPNLAPWHYNPWWMLASTSRGSSTHSEYQNGGNSGVDIKIKQEQSVQEQEDQIVKNEVMDQLSIIPIMTGMPKSSPTGSVEGACEECSDPYCDASSVVCRKLFHCPHCRKSYPTILEYNTHLAGVHPSQKPFRCQVCLEPWDKKAQLLRHLDASHTRKDMNKCAVCSKYIKDKSNLRKHMQVHTGRVPQKQFKCDLCNNKRYMSLDRLNNHRIVCTGEKVLKYCDMCSKVFDNTRSLNSHKKVHAKELKCELCGEQFRSLEHLNNHKVVCKFATRCCNLAPNCEHEKAYLNLPYGAERASRALDATLSALKSQMN